MTLKELFEGVLISTNKTQSPTLLLRDFNYILNDVVSDVVRDLYVAFEANQITLDYLKGLKRELTITNTGVLDPVDTTKTLQLVQGGLLPNGQPGSTVTDLPSDYRHFTGAILCYEVTTPVFDDCYKVGDLIFHGTKRHDADLRAASIADLFLKPTYFEPKHSIIGGKVFFITGDHPGIIIKSVQLEYLKTPAKLTLTQADAFNQTEDTSSKLEFDDITNKEIKRRLVQRIMERNGDPRTGSYTQVTDMQPPKDATIGVFGQQQ